MCVCAETFSISRGGKFSLVLDFFSLFYSVGKTTNISLFFTLLSNKFIYIFGFGSGLGFFIFIIIISAEVLLLLLLLYKITNVFYFR